MARSESTTDNYTQFNPNGSPAFGAPGGYGMMQVDLWPLPANAPDVWNWQQNVTDAEAMLVQKRDAVPNGADAFWNSQVDQWTSCNNAQLANKVPPPDDRP
jgi:hypothetical protein